MRQLGKSPKIEPGCQNIPVLSITPAPSDHVDLEVLLCRPQWKVHRADSLPSALSQLRYLRPIPLVVCERDLLQDKWQEVLMETMLLPEPPCFIVTSELADDYLWAEALNLGAYDVLTKPFDPIELTRSLRLAWQHGEDRREITRTQSTVSRVAAASRDGVTRLTRRSGSLIWGEKELSMLYDSTKVLLRGILWSLREADAIRWDDQAEWAGECCFEMHQMSRPMYQGYRTDFANIRPVLVPVFERATRAIPHLKLMARAIRRRDQAAAIESGTAALAEM